jgi:adenosylcobyric acid synthase
VLPNLDCVARLPAEDSVALERLSRRQIAGRVVVAVPVNGRIANFDDLDPLRAEPGVDVVFVRKGERLPREAALVVLAGSKTTIADLAEFRANGWENDLREHVAVGGRVIGICGGYQMLGRRVVDPGGIEGSQREIEGLGLLEVETVLEGEKRVVNVSAETADGVPLIGYEIHLGRTTGPDCSRPMIRIDGRPDGAISADGRVRGCYLHGLFSSDAFRANLLGELGVKAGPISHLASVEAALDELTAAIEKHVDVDGLLAAAREV